MYYCRRYASPYHFIDSCRQGPPLSHHHARLNFIIWRLTFPILTLLICLWVICLGQMGISAYDVLACPIWYFIHFILQAYPFLMIYRFQHVPINARGVLWTAFACASVLITFVDVIFSRNSTKNRGFGWLVGNTFYGILALVTLPCYFRIQTRVIIQEHDHAAEEQDHVPDAPPIQEPTNVLYISGLISILLGFTSWASYLSHDPKSTQIYWDWLIYLSTPCLCFVMFKERRTKFEYNFDYLIFYGITVVHIPGYLGHLTLFYFEMAHAESSEWMKFTVSIVFLLVMQGYFHMLVRVVQNLSKPFHHPSLLYIGQLYFYMFWYLLVGNDAPIDNLYWGMLLVNNIHIVVANTGLYGDFWGWNVMREIRMPFLVCIGSSTAMCYRASTLMKRSLSKQYDIPMHHHKRKESAGDVPVATCTHVAATTIEESIRNTGFTNISSTAVQLDYYHSKSSEESATCNRHHYSSSCSEDHHEEAEDVTNLLATTHLPDRQFRPLYFLMKMAEQDNMADTTALILVPTLLTVLAFLDAPAHGSRIVTNKLNLWLRCIFMFLGRVCSSYIAQEIFAYKLRAKLMNQKNSSLVTADIQTSRTLIQTIMLQDFQNQFWYLVIVTLSCTYACFERLEWPSRYAFLPSM